MNDFTHISDGPTKYDPHSRQEPEAVHKFPTGAVRCADSDHLAFDLICPTALSRLAARCALGAEKYGRQNWTRGMALLDVYNHIQTHLTKWRAGNSLDDDLAAAAWGIFALLHFESLCSCGDVQDAMDKRLDRYVNRHQQGATLGGGRSQEEPNSCQTTPPPRRRPE